jgi:Domain of unknown function (DUF5671)
MARTLYRVYLYVVSLVLLGFAAFSVGSLLNTLFLLTPIRGMYETAPSGQDVVRSIVLAIVALVISLALGGLHYWLIRRDIAQDAGAATGTVRSLFLNLAQTVAALVALSAGNSSLGQLGGQFYAGVAINLAIWLTALAVFVLAQTERARANPARGAPVVLQRLHLYGVQAVILVSALFTWTHTLHETVRLIFGYGASPQLVGGWLSIAWTAVAWGVYTWLARGDTLSVLRQVAHFFGFMVGLVATIYGTEQAAELLFRGLLHATTNVLGDLTTTFDFFPWLLFGLAVMLGYGLWLAMEASETPLGRLGTDLTVLTLSAIALGIAFYIGVARLLTGAVEAVVPNGSPLGAAGWAAAAGLAIAGLAHPLLAYRLWQRTTVDAPIGPRRGYVLAGLAAGGLAATIAAARVLYLAITALLGTPSGSDWTSQARNTLVIMVVGGFVAGIHLWRLLAERKLIPHPSAGRSETGAPSAPTAPAADAAIEGVLDALLAGRITREQAAAQLKALIHAGG